MQYFIGATPERLVKKKENQVLSTCLAGSIKRGSTTYEDNVLGQQLLQDDKNLNEHNIVVKMIKEVFKDCCYDIEVPNDPALLKTKNIQHLYTPVKGLAKEGQTLLSLVEKLHPTPALGGFPQVKAIEKIRELEPMHRGWYAAPIGWLDYEDNGEFVVAIRSGLIEGNKAALFAGCGIVAESDPKSEYFETRIKLKPMLSALGGVENE
jgi:menaquinone-specific isochorismate synthase